MIEIISIIMLGMVGASACAFTTLALIYASVIVVKEIYKRLNIGNKKE